MHEADEVHQLCDKLVVAGRGGQLATWRLGMPVKHDGLQQQMETEQRQ
jgi:ABC-type sugar transport system ATPase subunit